jgi:hypothetical protein
MSAAMAEINIISGGVAAKRRENGGVKMAAAAIGVAAGERKSASMANGES